MPENIIIKNKANVHKFSRTSNTTVINFLLLKVYSLHVYLYICNEWLLFLLQSTNHSKQYLTISWYYSHQIDMNNIQESKHSY